MSVNFVMGGFGYWNPLGFLGPRSYIIAGLRSQLIDSKMIDDFRILNESLKNIDILFYDDLVENLETFVKRIGDKKD